MSLRSVVVFKERSSTHKSYPLLPTRACDAAAAANGDDPMVHVASHVEDIFDRRLPSIFIQVRDKREGCCRREHTGEDRGVGCLL